MKNKNLIIFCLVSFLSLGLAIKNNSISNYEITNDNVHYHNEETIKKLNNINSESKNLIKDNDINIFYKINIVLIKQLNGVTNLLQFRI